MLCACSLKKVRRLRAGLRSAHLDGSRVAHSFGVEQLLERSLVVRATLRALASEAGVGPTASLAIELPIKNHGHHEHVNRNGKCDYVKEVIYLEPRK